MKQTLHTAIGASDLKEILKKLENIHHHQCWCFPPTTVSHRDPTILFHRPTKA
jgi:hypothetical protein